MKELYFEVHVTEHCNLNCMGCSHFSPLAKEGYLDIDAYENDCQRLSALTGGTISYIKLLGGEPLLHDNITEILRISRKYFNRYTDIAIITNGILLAKQKDAFWQYCGENNIKIGISKYPVNLPVKEIRGTAQKFGVEAGYFRGPLKIIPLRDENIDDKAMYHFKIDLSGGQNIKESFFHCNKSNNCFTLMDGRMYTCSTLPHIRHFNGYFHQNLNAEDEDSISIYDANSAEEILSFLSRPISFCRYCNTKDIHRGLKWAVSEKKITEWT